MGYEIGDFLADSYERALVEVHEIAINTDLSEAERLKLISELTERYGTPEPTEEPSNGE